MTIVTFDGSERHCKELYASLLIQSPGIFQQNEKLDNALYTDGSRSGFKPLILLLGKSECCGRNVNIRYVVVYTYFIEIN